MQNILFRPARTAQARCSIRVFSTTTRLSNFSRPIRTNKFVELLRKETHDPIWRLIEALRASKQRLDLSAALDGHSVSTPEFDRWKHILYEPDIETAVVTLRRSGPLVQRTEQKDHAFMLSQPPSWVVLYLAGYKVRTHHHATGPLMDLVYSHLDIASMNVQGPLLIFTALNLARFNLLLPMRRIVETFLTSPLSEPSLHFNLLLQAISCNPTRSTENANTVVSILKTMNARQLRLRSPTYEALLNDRFVTIQLTKFLRERMVQEGFTPKASHLEAYLRVFAKHGAIHDAQEYYEAIHARSADGQVHRASLNDLENRSNRANTLLLAAQGDRASAFTFLKDLTMSEASDTHSAPRQPVAKPGPRLVHKKTIDIFDFTAALSVATRDMTTTADHLIKIFERTQTRLSTIRPTVVTYTILIRGLIRRKSSKTQKYWNQLLQTGLTIDKEALTVGLQVLTRAGKPHEAFALLEKFAGRIKPPVGVYPLHQPVALTAVSINEFLVALNRISRPDIVFKLWDHMGQLYGVYPDSRTLSILLQSARLASKMDDSFAGAVAQLALKNPFRKLPARPISRESVVASIRNLLGEPKRPLIPYVSGIWNDRTPVEAAMRIFQQAVFGSSNSPAKLLETVGPAHAVRPSVDADPMTGLGLPRTAPMRTQFTPPPDLLTPEGFSHHPHIVVTDDNCFNYLILLGLASRATEIPLTLAWMRALDIEPSKPTLAVALVFWAEISMQAPLIETWSGGPERSEYTRLVEWIKEWVGEDGVPNERLLGHWEHIVAKMREAR